ncbi:MAG TPA: GNAT family N-acetyltransferase [Anaerolineales bacterium]|jgi:CelD/BcsL family acetyltransferase involved in cellulose biosynthesis
MEFKLHNTFEQLESIKSGWNALVETSVTNAPFLRFEYLSTWWSTRGGGEWNADAELAIITACENGELVGIAPLFLAANRDNQSALLLLGSIEISDYLDLIVRPDKHQAFVMELLNWLKSNYPATWQTLDWYNLPENSPSLSALKTSAAQFGWEYVETIYQPSPFIPLPGDFETYLSGIDKKQRHEIRRKIRRAEESGRSVRWYIVEDGSKLDSEMDGFLALMAHDPEKEAFLTNQMRVQMKNSVRAAFDAGYLQLAFLEVDGEKACAYLNFDYDNKIWVYNSGLDRRFMDLSVGWVLLGYLLEWANNHKRVEFDFLRGDEDYKYKFGGQKRHVMRVKISR